MGQVRHGIATTTHAIRAAIQRSLIFLATLSLELGINPKTVAKWRKRQPLEDMKTGPKEPRSTTLSQAEEAMVVAFRRGLPPEKFSNRIRQAGWLRSAHTPGSWFSPRSASLDRRMLASDGWIDRSGPRGCRWHRIFRDGLIRAIRPGGDASVVVS